MKLVNGLLLGLAVVCVVAIGLVLSGVFNDNKLPQIDLRDGTGGDEKIERQLPPNRPLSEAIGAKESDMVVVGDVKRPKRDIDFDKATSKNPDLPASLFPNPGSAPALKGDENEQVAGLIKEIQGGNRKPEAVSTYTLAKDFDLKTYQKDPQAYVKKIRPGRVYEPAQPKEGVTRIDSESPYYRKILQGESVIFRAKVNPGAPVTFYTPAVGEFQNRLTTQTVVADENGIAKATYKAGPGTLGVTDVMAASPVHSGQLRYVLNIALPKTNTSKN